MRVFRWLAAGAIAAGYDLRRLGWRLLDGVGAPDGAARPPLLVEPAGISLDQWLKLTGSGQAACRLVLMLGVDDPQERARLLRLGFGDVLGSSSTVHEVEVRTLRLLDHARTVPRQRQFGALRLDLLTREAFVAGRAVRLYPREFALLWRLADTPGQPVSPGDLITDVWRLAFRPETNSLAVHVSRLRAKLRLAGVGGLIETRPDGSYCIARNCIEPWPALPLPPEFEQFALDAHVRLGKEHGRDRMQSGPAAEQKDNDHAA